MMSSSSYRIANSALALATLFGACVLQAREIESKLTTACADEVPLVFRKRSAGRAIASLSIDEMNGSLSKPEVYVSLLFLEVSAAAGIEDFAFADRLSVDLVSASAELAPLRVLDKAATEAAGSPWLAEGDASIDLSEHLFSAPSELRLEIDGAIPSDSFLVSLETCLHVEGIELVD